MQRDTRQRPPGLNQDELTAWKAFLRAHAVITRALERQLLASRDLPLAEYDVLVQLSEAPGRALRMAQLADQVLLSRSGLTRLVERMEQSGLVQRQSCPNDARGSLAVLTERGQELLRSAAPGHLDAVRTHFVDPLGKDQLALLSPALERLAASCPQSSAPACVGDQPERNRNSERIGQ
ncbi:MAG: MarR family winged helix-turn-helix transcriptional regulator [Candidatus Dormibacteria bacterium]